LHFLVGVDPVTEEADTGVDGREGHVASGTAPGRGSDEGVAALGRATAVTIASADGVGQEADVTVVDLGGRPAVGAVSVREDRHSSDLQCVRQTARSACSAPSGDLTVLAGIVSSVGSSHVSIAGVGVRRDVRGPSDRRDVVRVTLSAAAAVVGMSGLSV